MTDKRPLIIISGATGVGKTELSLKLAKDINGEIISADSMAVYRSFDIGTAKIRPDEMNGIRHHLIDILDPDQEFNIYEFRKLSKEAIDGIYSAGHIPIIVGGTGFYIQSVLYDIDFSETDGDRIYRTELKKTAEEKGSAYLHSLLAEIDPDSAELIHPNNVKRVIRALEYYHETGEMISEHNHKQSRKQSPYNFAYFVLERERETVYRRINERVDRMMDDGLVNEVRSLLDKGISPECHAMQGIGYKEILPYIQGDITLDEAVETLKKNSRNFAKRQDTWFRREKDIIRIKYEDYPDSNTIIGKMEEILTQKGIINVQIPGIQQ